MRDGSRWLARGLRHLIVMAGHSRIAVRRTASLYAAYAENGVASLAYVPAIHVFLAE